MFTGDRAGAGDKRNTGAGALSGNWMRDDESEMVGDNHVGSLGDSLFGSQSHVKKGDIKVTIDSEFPILELMMTSFKSEFNVMILDLIAQVTLWLFLLRFSSVLHEISRDDRFWWRLKW
ncbi:hypothetical protein L2E82_26789 [Cichorium intybus]|uniref:Uncharacterized protein n=1 Tax=Cichorium intybus TaxID=13427 RepID=A0ACB9CR96_CICIN|nr:hypothetical protein L2E82_26789 [Cichorium intybus]